MPLGLAAIRCLSEYFWCQSNKQDSHAIKNKRFQTVAFYSFCRNFDRPALPFSQCPTTFICLIPGMYPELLVYQDDNPAHTGPQVHLVFQE